MQQQRLRRLVLILDAIEKYFPLKRFRTHESDRPWISPKMKGLIIRRRKSLTKFGKHSANFKMWRNKIQRSINSCKMINYNNKVRCLKETNIGKWWSEIKSLSDVCDRGDHWYRQLIDGDTIASVTQQCDMIKDCFVESVAGLTPSPPLTS